MTPAEIAALRALCDAATPGPWKPGVFWRDGAYPVGPYTRNEATAKADASFIAAARTALPAALSALEEATKAKGAALLACATAHDRANAAESALEEARNFGRAQDEKAHRFLEERNGARESLAAAESRADALQAEVRVNAALWDAWKIRAEAAEARADAAWRAGAEVSEAGDALLVGYPITKERNRLLGAIKKFRALPPPSATPNEET